jgi:hypothetical protein
MSTESYSLFDDDEEDVEDSLNSDLHEELQQIIVYNLDWTVETLLSQFKNGTIDLQPQYQRRDAWDIKRKSRLIESLVLGLPIPHLVLAERHDEKGSFLILDGKQRLTCLAQFSGSLPDSPFNNFTLRDLPLLPQLDGVSFLTLLESDEYRKWRNALLNQPIRTAIIRGWRTEDLLHVVFHRLNSEVVRLSPQELRQAIIRGPFMAFLNEYSAKSETMRWLLRLPGPDFRMRDSELLLRLLGLTKYRDEYRGDLRRFLDATARKLSQNWSLVSSKTVADLEEIEAAIEVWREVLGPADVGRKFINGQYERRFNRAVLDSQVYAALDSNVAARMRMEPLRIKELFETLMTSDRRFVTSVEATTKSLDSVHYRMDTLRKFLQ